MYGRLLRQAGPANVGSYDWYQVLDDFLQGRTAMAIDSSNFATDISNPAKSRVAKQAGFAAFPHLAGRAPSPTCRTGRPASMPSRENKKAAFLFMLWATSKPTSLQTAAAGLATTRLSAWSSEGFKKAFGRAGGRGGADQFATWRCRPHQGDHFPSAIESHPGRLHDRRQ